MPDGNHRDPVRSERLRTVDEHISRENAHDLDGIPAAFGQNAHYVGLDGVRTFYTQMLEAMPDLHIDVRQQHVAEGAVIVGPAGSPSPLSSRTSLMAPTAPASLFQVNS